jgi:hypothetical protein
LANPEAVSGVSRYEDIDWRDQKNWKCDRQASDVQDTSLHEALFIETEGGKLLASRALAEEAAKFEQWLKEEVHAVALLHHPEVCWQSFQAFCQLSPWIPKG